MTVLKMAEIYLGALIVFTYLNHNIGTHIITV